MINLIFQDSYLDDESTDADNGSNNQPRSLTEEKWRNYGTPEAAEKSRRQAAKAIHEMAGK